VIRPAARLTGRRLADRCLEALAVLGGEASSLAIREQIGLHGVTVSQADLSYALTALARRVPPPVTALGGGSGGHGHERYWRLAGDGPQADDRLSRDQSRIAGRNMRALRVAARRRQRDVAADAGVSQSTLSSYERGFTRIPVDRAQALAKALGTTAEALTAEGGAGG
jgi:DNA-binding XRE family transcriptional regulator